VKRLAQSNTVLVVFPVCRMKKYAKAAKVKTLYTLKVKFSKNKRKEEFLKNTGSSYLAKNYIVNNLLL
jgi:hypothetical protein